MTAGGRALLVGVVRIGSGRHVGSLGAGPPTGRVELGGLLGGAVEKLRVAPPGVYGGHAPRPLGSQRLSGVCEQTIKINFSINSTT